MNPISPYAEERSYRNAAGIEVSCTREKMPPSDVAGELLRAFASASNVRMDLTLFARLVPTAESVLREWAERMELTLYTHVIEDGISPMTTIARVTLPNGSEISVFS